MKETPQDSWGNTTSGLTTWARPAIVLIQEESHVFRSAISYVNYFADSS